MQEIKTLKVLLAAEKFKLDNGKGEKRVEAALEFAIEAINELEAYRLMVETGAADSLVEAFRIVQLTEELKGYEEREKRERQFICRRCGLREELGEKMEVKF